MYNVRLLRNYINCLVREEAARIGGLGSRNMFTVNTEPILWHALPGYDVETVTGLDGSYQVDVYFDNKKLGSTRQFNDEAEAMHYARSIVDKHRIKHNDTL